VPVLRAATRGDRPFLPGPERAAELSGERPDPGLPPAHAGFDPALRIDWLGAEELAGERPGRLGMTFLPGKRGASVRYPGHVYRRDTAGDLAAMRAGGVVLLVLLVEDGELRRWGDPDIAGVAAAAGVDLARFPIPDGHAARSMGEMDEIQSRIDDARASGDVVVACMGGVGRTGMVAACALVRAGQSAPDAIARVRQLRHPTAVETHVQEAFVRAYAVRSASAG
jgi:protein-tyrosine phosphatase